MSQGTYAAFKPCKESAISIYKAALKLGVKDIIPIDKLHITLLYSRKAVPDFIPMGAIDPVEISATEIIPLGNALVLKVRSLYIYKRHLELMRIFEAEHDYDEYIPHLSLSYNKDIQDPEIFEKFKPFTFKICLEYKEDLKID